MPWCCGHGERRLSRTTQQRMRSDPEPHCPLAHDAAIAPTPRAVQPWSAATRAASTVAHQPRRATFARCPKQPRRREFGTKLLMDSPFWPDAPNLASPARYPWRQLARRPRDTVTNPSELRLSDVTAAVRRPTSDPRLRSTSSTRVSLSVSRSTRGAPPITGFGSAGAAARATTTARWPRRMSINPHSPSRATARCAVPTAMWYDCASSFLLGISDPAGRRLPLRIWDRRAAATTS